MTIESMERILAMPSIGNFKCIELFEVIGIKDSNPPFNIFSLAVAHETDLPLTKKEKITPNLIKLKADKSLKFGVFKRIVSIEDFVNIISDLVTTEANEDDGNKLCYGHLKAIPPVYVPALERGKNEFLGLLKNNFFGGSHLFEWFDESKEYVTPLMENLAALDDLSGKLQEYLPIKIGTHSDRLGNIIVQIPCAAVAFAIERRDEHSHRLLSNLAVSPHFSEINFSGIFWREQHGSIIDFQKIPLVVGENIIPFQQINGSGYYAVWDESNQIICAGGEVRFLLEQINLAINMQEQIQRIFKLPDGTEQRIDICVQTSQSHIGNNAKDYRYWVSNRLLKIEKHDLHNSLKLRQFKRDMRQEAFDFIRELIEKYGKNGIYLWDPYLNAKDLLETVFFSPYANSPIKALTGLKLAPQENKTSSYKADLANEINQAIRQASWLNLIFVNADRSKVGDFHDRFIIFPQAIDEPVRAWSLGTSVNSLGKSHHIIQEVEDGQIIADVFEEMWEQSINDEDNIIWKSANS